MRSTSVELNFGYGVGHESCLSGLGVVRVGLVVLQALRVALLLRVSLRLRVGSSHVAILLLMMSVWLTSPVGVLVRGTPVTTAVVVVSAVILVLSAVIVVVVATISSLPVFPSKILIATGAATNISASKAASFFVAM